MDTVAKISEPVEDKIDKNIWFTLYNFSFC